MLLGWLSSVAWASTVVSVHVPAVGDLNEATCVAGEVVQLGAPGAITNVRTGAVVGAYRDLGLAVGPRGSGWAIWRGDNGLLVRPFDAAAIPTADAVHLRVDGSPLLSRSTDHGGLVVLTSERGGEPPSVTQRLMVVDAAQHVAGPFIIDSGPHYWVDGMAQGPGLARIFLGGSPNTEDALRVIDITVADGTVSQQIQPLAGPGFGGFGRPTLVDLPGGPEAMWVHPSGTVEWVGTDARRSLEALSIPPRQGLSLDHIRPTAEGVVVSLAERTVVTRDVTGGTLESAAAEQGAATWVMDPRSPTAGLVAVDSGGRFLTETIAVGVGGDLRWHATPTGVTVLGRTDSDVTIQRIKCTRADR